MPQKYLTTSLLAALALAACSSADTKAARAAAEADAALQQGRVPDALRSAREALAARDDVSDYWLLLGRISLAANDLGSAFTAYENVIQLDRSNVEALRILCQLGLAARQPDKVDKFADLLLMITPNDFVPVVMKGGAALQRGDQAGAMAFAEQVLGKNPADSGALILKARVFASQAKFSEAAALIEGSLTPGADDSARLAFLKDLYAQSQDRPRFALTLKRLAASRPKDAGVQLDYADLLYQTGQNDAANTVIRQVMLDHPSDIGVAADILDLWLKEGPDAVPTARIASDAGNMSLEMKSTYAQFANEIGHPEIAVAILGAGIAGAPTTDNADAKASMAYAMGLRGRRADAIGRLDDIIEFDPDNPRALLARAKIKLASGDRQGAIADARMVVADDAQNATARLTLVDALLAHNDTDLAQVTLREGVRAMPGDPRLTVRLAKMLIAQGQQQAARDALRDMTRAVPTSLRAQRARLALDPSATTDRSIAPAVTAAS